MPGMDLTAVRPSLPAGLLACLLARSLARSLARPPARLLAPAKLHLAARCSVGAQVQIFGHANSLEPGEIADDGQDMLGNLDWMQNEHTLAGCPGEST